MYHGKSNDKNGKPAYTTHKKPPQLIPTLSNNSQQDLAKKHIQNNQNWNTKPEFFFGHPIQFPTGKVNDNMKKPEACPP